MLQNPPDGTVSVFILLLNVKMFSSKCFQRKKGISNNCCWGQRPSYSDKWEARTKSKISLFFRAGSGDLWISCSVMALAKQYLSVSADVSYAAIISQARVEKFSQLRLDVVKSAAFVITVFRFLCWSNGWNSCLDGNFMWKECPGCKYKTSLCIRKKRKLDGILVLPKSSLSTSVFLPLHDGTSG